MCWVLTEQLADINGNGWHRESGSRTFRGFWVLKFCE